MNKTDDGGRMEVTTRSPEGAAQKSHETDFSRLANELEMTEDGLNEVTDALEGLFLHLHPPQALGSVFMEPEEGSPKHAPEVQADCFFLNSEAAVQRMNGKLETMGLILERLLAVEVEARG